MALRRWLLPALPLSQVGLFALRGRGQCGVVPKTGPGLISIAFWLAPEGACRERDLAALIHEAARPVVANQ